MTAWFGLVARVVQACKLGLLIVLGFAGVAVLWRGQWLVGISLIGLGLQALVVVAAGLGYDSDRVFKVGCLGGIVGMCGLSIDITHRG